MNCENILLTGSAKLENVVLLVRLDDFVGLNEEYAKFFPIDPPTRPVAKLGDELPDVLVSTEMIVAL